MGGPASVLHNSNQAINVGISSAEVEYAGSCESAIVGRLRNGSLEKLKELNLRESTRPPLVKPLAFWPIYPTESV
jgi:hypothetical protein